MTNAASLKSRLAAGGTLSALWMDLGSTGVAEVMSEARPDIMIFDMQHGLWDRRSMFDGFAAIRGKCQPVVRVAANNPVVIGEALDMGAAGVIVPLVETAEQAKAAIAAAKYPPAGNRSAGGTRPMLDFRTYATEANETVLVSVMIETALGLKNAVEIAAVPGVDLVFIGPGDLSISMGEFPDPGPKHEAAIQTILAACRKAKTPCGLFTTHASFAVERMRQGFQLVLWGNDHDFLLTASKANAAWFAGGGRKTSLKGAVALVTGTNRGIGPATVKALLAAGAAKVYCGARDAKSIAKLIATSPKKLVAIELDVTRPEQVAKAAKTCSDVTLLVNNAGVNFNTPLIGHDGTENARHEMEVNYFGTLAMCRAFAPALKKARSRDNKGGTIVNMLSVLAHVNLPLMGSLCASKAALLSLTQALRAELAAQGTHVMAVLPGAVDTDMTAMLTIPKMKPADVADAIVHGLEYGLEEIYPGDMAMGLAAGISQDAKSVEKQFAGFLSQAK
jgi:2-keto-3-deoxy-L-rhamnonate aldolase RhmA/NAD(P)-dependent dehydrogenase (short-subunit alcohol dehydrogenase family)